MDFLKNKQFNNFPFIRMRRNRIKEFSRRIVRENELTVNDLIYPIFITFGDNKIEPISHMPGLFRYSLDCLEKEIILLGHLPEVRITPMKHGAD